MKKTKFRSITIAALALLFAFVLSLAIGSLARTERVLAQDYRPGSIFSAGTSGTVETSEAAEDGTKYIRFTLNDNGKVHYRRDLALKWYSTASVPEEDGSGEEETEGGAEAQTAEDTARVNPAEQHYFSLGFEFVELSFKEFSLEFESMEENFSKDSTSKNAIRFYNEDGKVTVAVQNASEQDDDEWKPEGAVEVDVTGGVKINFDEAGCSIGEFAVYVNGVYVDKLTNVGGNYMEYLSSASSTPRIPITFTAEELLSGKTKLELLVKELNGQTFEVNESDKVTDNAPAVLVLNEKIYNYTLGKRWNLTYKAIDVCDDTVTVTRRYAMLKAEDGVWKKPVKDDYKTLTTSTYFMPTSDKTEKEEQYVSIYFELDDGTSGLTDEQKEARRIYLTWYAVEDAVSQMGEGEEAFDYIIVDRGNGNMGPKYNGITPNDAQKENDVDEELLYGENGLATEYQKAVDEASKNLSAGSGSYFYLPSLRGLIGSDHADYRNLRFSVYYRRQSDEVGSTAKAAASLRYNALRFEVAEEGKYIFKVLASDSSSNVMQYYYEGKLQNVTSANIWELEEIPYFTFEAAYTGATIEDPGSQSDGYSEQSYTFENFDVVALSGYEKAYKLYKLSGEDLPEGVTLPAYDTFIEDSAENFETFKKYMTEIKVFNSSITEDDKDRWNNSDNAYNWNPDNALSFTPQESAYYILELEVTESRLPGHSVTAYQVVQVRNKVDPLPNPFGWLENNVTSVILFSISAALLIVIVILFVVKPSEKNVEEIDLESLKGSKKHKK